jgi:antitoxin CptB
MTHQSKMIIQKTVKNSTISNDNAKAEFSRTRWRCRRGMLELDILLNRFIESNLEMLSPEQSEVFDTLLDYPDQTLYDLLLEKMNASDAAISELIKLIRKTAI